MRGYIVEDGESVLHWPRTEILSPRVGKPRRILLLDDFSYEWEAEGKHQKIVIRAGQESDGASVPKALHWYIGWTELLPAAVPHDELYANGGFLEHGQHLLRTGGEFSPISYIWTREEADRLFARMLDLCTTLTRTQRRHAYRAVRLFGGGSWKRR